MTRSLKKALIHYGFTDVGIERVISNRKAVQDARAIKRREDINRDLAPALAARDQRNIGYAARDLTGAAMGDPPVGFSALDRRGADGR